MEPTWIQPPAWWVTAKYHGSESFEVAPTTAEVYAGLKGLYNDPAVLKNPLRPAFYTIQRGDTLVSIAKQHATSVEHLLALNPEAKPRALSPGQVLFIRTKQAAPVAPPPGSVHAKIHMARTALAEASEAGDSAEKTPAPKHAAFGPTGPGKGAVGPSPASVLSGLPSFPSTGAGTGASGSSARPSEEAEGTTSEDREPSVRSREWEEPNVRGVGWPNYNASPMPKRALFADDEDETGRSSAASAEKWLSGIAPSDPLSATESSSPRTPSPTGGRNTAERWLSSVAKKALMFLPTPGAEPPRGAPGDPCYSHPVLILAGEEEDVDGFSDFESDAGTVWGDEEESPWSSAVVAAALHGVLDTMGARRRPPRTAPRAAKRARGAARTDPAAAAAAVAAAEDDDAVSALEAVLDNLAAAPASPWFPDVVRAADVLQLAPLQDGCVQLLQVHWADFNDEELAGIPPHVLHRAVLSDGFWAEDEYARYQAARRFFGVHLARLAEDLGRAHRDDEEEAKSHPLGGAAGGILASEWVQQQWSALAAHQHAVMARVNYSCMSPEQLESIMADGLAPRAAVLEAQALQAPSADDFERRLGLADWATLPMLEQAVSSALELGRGAGAGGDGGDGWRALQQRARMLGSYVLELAASRAAGVVDRASLASLVARRDALALPTVGRELWAGAKEELGMLQAADILFDKLAKRRGLFALHRAVWAAKEDKADACYGRNLAATAMAGLRGAVELRREEMRAHYEHTLTSRAFAALGRSVDQAAEAAGEAAGHHARAVAARGLRGWAEGIAHDGKVAQGHYEKHLTAQSMDGLRVALCDARNNTLAAGVQRDRWLLRRVGLLAARSRTPSAQVVIAAELPSLPASPFVSGLPLGNLGATSPRTPTSGSSSGLSSLSSASGKSSAAAIPEARIGVAFPGVLGLEKIAAKGTGQASASQWVRFSESWWRVAVEFSRVTVLRTTAVPATADAKAPPPTPRRRGLLRGLLGMGMPAERDVISKKMYTVRFERCCAAPASGDGEHPEHAATWGCCGPAGAEGAEGTEGAEGAEGGGESPGEPERTTVQWRLNLITPTGATKLHASWDAFATGESVGVGMEAEVLPQLLVGGELRLALCLSDTESPGGGRGGARPPTPLAPLVAVDRTDRGAAHELPALSGPPAIIGLDFAPLGGPGGGAAGGGEACELVAVEGGNVLISRRARLPPAATYEDIRPALLQGLAIDGTNACLVGLCGGVLLDPRAPGAATAPLSSVCDLRQPIGVEPILCGCPHAGCEHAGASWGMGA